MVSTDEKQANLRKKPINIVVKILESAVKAVFAAAFGS